MSMNRILAVFASAVFATGCSGIGDGSKIESIRIIQNTTQPDVALTEVQAFTCVRSGLTLVGEFSQGDIGNFSNRARWTSENPDVIQVTNVGDPVGDDSGDVFLVGGVLLPQAASALDGDGNPIPTTVVAEYLGLRTEVDITVSAASEVRIEPSILRVVPNTFSNVSVRARLDGVDTDITAFAQLAFVDDAEVTDPVAILSSSAQGASITAVAVGGPLTFTADTGVPCDPIQATAFVADPVGDLELGFEEGFENGQLAEGTAQFLTLTARFGDFTGAEGGGPDGSMDDEGEFQNLGNQSLSFYRYDVDGDGVCELRDEDPGTTEAPNAPAPVVFGSFFSGFNLMIGVVDEDGDDETTLICADYGFRAATTGEDPQPEVPGRPSNVLTVNLVDAPLLTLAILASDSCEVDDPLCERLDPQPNAMTPSVPAGRTLQLDVTGTFEGGHVQNLNKNVAWVSSNPRLANVVAGISPIAGFLATVPDLDTVEECEGLASCQATITATWGANTTTTDDDEPATIVVTVTRPAEEAEEAAP